jgi:hypothetical protein
MTPFPGPTHGPESWKQWLAQPDKHWKPGFSAWALAHAWEAAGGFPPEISALLATAPDLAGAALLLAVPEYKVELPGGPRASQNDLLCVCRTKAGLATLAVEGKVDEPFGETLDEWRRDESRDKVKRLDYLTWTLGLKAPVAGTIRYQLLHRTASALIEAERFHATAAALIVHSFSPTQESLGDYRAFLGLFDKTGGVGQMVALGSPNGVRLWAGWAQGDAKYLKA